MSEERNLELNVETLRQGGQEVARIAVGLAAGFAHSGAATLTQNCDDAESLEREVTRLKEELDSALEEARAHFGVASAKPAKKAEAAAKDTPERPHLDAGLLVRDVMTRDVKTVHRNDPLSLADELMKQGRFRHVVVLDEDGTLAGVISHRDIFLGALAWSMGQGRTAHDRALSTAPAKEVMNAQPVTVEPDTRLSDAAALLREHKIGCLPVLERDTLVGVLTEGDFLALIAG